MDSKLTSLQKRFHIPNEEIDDPTSIEANVMSPYSVSFTKTSWRMSIYEEIDESIPKKHGLLCDLLPYDGHIFNKPIVIKKGDEVFQEIDELFAELWYTYMKRLPLFFGHNSRSNILVRYFYDHDHLHINIPCIAHYKMLSHIESSHISNECGYRPLLGSFWEKYNGGVENEENIVRSIMLIDVSGFIEVKCEDVTFINVSVENILNGSIDNLDDSCLVKFTYKDMTCVYWRNSLGVAGLPSKINIKSNSDYTYIENLRLARYW